MEEVAPPERQRHRRRSGRWLVASVVAAIVVVGGLIASVVMALQPDHNSHAGLAASTPASSARPLLMAGSVTASATASAPAVATSAASRTSPSASSTPSPKSASAPLAGRIRPGVSYSGVATEYSAGNGDGACLFGPAADMMIAAMNYTDYDTAKACGAYVLVHAADGASITVLITNECPAPCAPGQLDLSQQAFAKLANPTLGRIPITWQLVSPAAVGTMSVRYKTGSSQYWCGIQVIGHRNPIAQLEVRAGDTWRQLPRTDYNYFISANGSGCGGALRITDVYGQQLTVSALAVLPNVVQPTHVQFAEH